MELHPTRKNSNNGEDERPAKRVHFSDDDPINDDPINDDPINDANAHVFNLKPELLENIQKLADSFEPPAEKSFFGQEVTVSHNPFPFCVVENFLQGSNMINDLIGDLEKMKFEKNQTDMFQLSMSDDLTYRREPTIVALKTFLRAQVMPWVGKLTQTKLETMKFVCVKKGHTDFSLCDNGQEEGKLVRFVLNLGPDFWTEEDGGLFELFNNSYGEAAEVYQTILPKPNSFLFYKVTPVSFVQISEVLSPHKTSLTIMGSFGTKDQFNADDNKTDDNTLVDFYGCVSELYFHSSTRESLQRSLRKTGQATMVDFLDEDKYQKVAKALKDADLEFQTVGPPNLQKFQVLPIELIKNADLKECVDLFRSEDMSDFLMELAGQKTEMMSQNCQGPFPDGTKTEIRRWNLGNYKSLQATQEDDFFLEARFFICKNQNTGGGSSISLSGIEQEPKPNTLHVMLRDQSYVQYVNSSGSEFHDICLTLNKEEDQEFSQNSDSSDEDDDEDDPSQWTSFLP